MKKKSISNSWLFEEDIANAMWWRDASVKKEVDLPHDYAVTHPRSPETPGRGGNGFFNGGFARYTKFIKFGNKEHTVLDIDGAYMCAEIKLNHDLLAIHPNGYTPFLLDITDNIVWGKHNKLQIFTNDMQPSSRWYAGAGLYRDVFLWTGGDVRIEPWDLYVVTNSADGSKASITVKTKITADFSTDAVLKISIIDKNKNTAAEETRTIAVSGSEKVDADTTIEISNPLLWDTENPNLYTLNAEILVNGEVTDTVEQSFGIREIRFSVENGMTLNGKSIKLRGGCIHHDHGGLGVCAYPAAEERKIKKLKAAGFNALRMAHNPPSSAFLEICDREGILVMDEAFDMWRCAKVSNDYHLWFEDWWARDISYMVLRDRIHPCVVSYSIGNEIHEANGRSNGAKWSKRLSDEIRKYDTSRPVTSAVCGNWDNWDKEAENAPEDYREIFYRGHKKLANYIEDITGEWNEWFGEYIKPLDIVGYNYGYQRYTEDHKKYPERIIWGSETHALNFYHSWKEVEENSYVLGDFTWTAYDNMGETGAGRFAWGENGKLAELSISKYPWRNCYQGDFDLAGFRRPQSYFREAVWFENAPLKIFTVHPKHNGQSFTGTGWHWYDVSDNWTFDDEYIGKDVSVQVYSRADLISFTLNGRHIADSVPKAGIAEAKIPYEKGSLCACAIKNGKKIAETCLVTVGKAEKIAVAAEKSEICADGRDLAYFEIFITDADGNRVTCANHELSCHAEGGDVLCIFSGDPKCDDQFTQPKCHAFEGRAIAVVKTKTKGKITLTVSADDLTAASAEINAV